MAHLIFSIVVLTVDQMMKFIEWQKLVCALVTQSGANKHDYGIICEKITIFTDSWEEDGSA